MIFLLYNFVISYIENALNMRWLMKTAEIFILAKFVLQFYRLYFYTTIHIIKFYTF